MSEKTKKTEKKKVDAKKTKAPKVKESTKKVKAPKVETPKAEEAIKTDVKGTPRKRKLDFKTWFLVGCSVIALIVVITAFILLNQVEKVDSSFFHDDDRKVVLTMSKNVAALDDTEWEPDITHVVYFHDGDKITSSKAYYEYKNDEQAREAFDNLSLGEFANGKKLSGRFVIFSVKSDLFKDLTLSALLDRREKLKEIHALILNYDAE